MTADRSTAARQPAHGDGAAAAQPPAALRSALVGAIGRHRRRMRLRFAIGAGAGAAVAAVVLGGGLFTQAPPHALAIDTDAGRWVEVRVLDGQAGAEEMTRELQDAGIDAEVRPIPAVPGLVGHWMGIGQIDPPPPPPCNLPPDAPPGLRCIPAPVFMADEVNTHGDLLAIRRDAVYKLADSTWVFYVGRAPQAGEQPLDRPPPNSP